MTKVTKWRTTIEKYMQSKGSNIKLTTFAPLSYKTQVVAGTNWDFVINVPNIKKTLEVRVWEKLGGDVQVTRVDEKEETFTGMPEGSKKPDAPE